MRVSRQMWSQWTAVILTSNHMIRVLMIIRSDQLGRTEWMSSIIYNVHTRCVADTEANVTYQMPLLLQGAWWVNRAQLSDDMHQGGWSSLREWEREQTGAISVEAARPAVTDIKSYDQSLCNKVSFLLVLCSYYTTCMPINTRHTVIYLILAVNLLIRSFLISMHEHLNYMYLMCIYGVLIKMFT